MRIPLTDPCTCGHRGICLDCQLNEHDLAQAAALLLLDPFVVAAAEMNRRLADAFADSGLTEREQSAIAPARGDRATGPSRSVSPSNVVLFVPPKGQL